jgi:hypothetical protein
LISEDYNGRVILFLISFIVNLPSHVWSVFTNDPAEWTAAILLLATFILQFDQHRKKVKLEGEDRWAGSDKLVSGYVIIANNLGERKIFIAECGVKLWDGACIVAEAKGGAFVIPPVDRRIFQFSEYNPHTKRTTSEIYYHYLVDGNGKVYRKYSKFFVRSWATRFYIWSTDRLNALWEWSSTQIDLAWERLNRPERPNPIRDKLRATMNAPVIAREELRAAIKKYAEKEPQ